MDKASIIKADQENKVYDFLSSAFKLTRDGYTRISMSQLAREFGLNPTSVLSVIKRLDIIRHMNGKRNALWHWNGNAPDHTVARRVVSEIGLIKTNSREDARVKAQIKARNLVPIIGIEQGKVQSQPTTIHILDQMYQNRGELLTMDGFKQNYPGCDKFIQALVDLDVIKANQQTGLYSWVWSYPDKTLVNLINDEINPHKMAEQNKLSKDDVSDRIKKLLSDIHENPHVGSMGKRMNEIKLASVYWSAMRKLGYIDRRGTLKTPVYHVNSPVTDEDVSLIQQEVANIWRETSRTRRSKRQATAPDNIQSDIAKSTECANKKVENGATYGPFDSTNMKINMALNRRAELQAEIDRIDEYVKAVQHAMQLENALNLA